jgi:shikimate dehydrogenase
MANFGLIGKNIAYSFSQKYFTEKFKKEKLAHSYYNFDLETLAVFKKIVNETSLKGLNVTIPYKEKIMPYLDYIDRQAQIIGAVNTIKFLEDGVLVGYNTDHYGFSRSLANFPIPKSRTALILGNGGASKAIKYALESLNFRYTTVSRNKTKDTITYEQVTKQVLENHTLIVNTTPLGVAPDVLKCPNIPYEHITKEHFLFDLIYNPHQTTFLKHGLTKGATIANGSKMLEYQAQKAWSIWNS